MGEYLQQRLEDWVAHGLLDPGQVEGILAHERAQAPADPARRADAPRGPIVAEAVGYLGAVLTVVAGGLVIGEFWDRITPWGRLLLTALLTLVVFTAGWVLRTKSHPAVQRLTSLLWFATSVGVAFTVGLAADQQQAEDRLTILLVVAGVLVISAGLYALRRTPLQLLALSLGVAGTAIAALAYPRASVDLLFFGLLLWSLGTAWFLLALGRWLRPPDIAAALGLLAVGIGCQVGASGSYDAVAIILALVSAGILIWLSTRIDDTLVLAFGVAGVFVFVPQGVFRFFGDSIGAPLALLLTGLLLVATAVGMITLRRSITEEAGT